MLYNSDTLTIFSAARNSYIKQLYVQKDQLEIWKENRRVLSQGRWSVKQDNVCIKLRFAYPNKQTKTLANLLIFLPVHVVVLTEG